ncbi:MAG: hypothetical protein GYB32_00830 [Algicola sp.]|nr:hypothetical protein [Algicola sp.]
MKKFVILVGLLLNVTLSEAQEVFMVDGERLVLKNEVDGRLDLLWNIIDGNYRYFVRTESNTIVELKNTKKDGKYQEEYKAILYELTNASMSTDRLNLTLFSLKEFIDTYNSSVDASYESTVTRNKLQFRLGAFAGITNNPFITNPDNLTTPLFGAELEVLDVKLISRHAVFLQFRHVLEQDELQYSTSELGLGYRFRAINNEGFSLYGNVKLATLNFSNATVVTENEGSVVTEEFNETAFDVPLTFGIGADIKVGKDGYITLAYNELFSVLLDNQGNFPIDFAVGYKFNL